MKSILLTSTALVAFAGAATAGGHTSISFSGEASAEYNSITGFGTSTSMDASMSAALDNGLTATASLSFESDDEMDGTITGGSVGLEGDSAGVTFGYGLDGAAFTAGPGDDYGLGLGEEGVNGVTGFMGFGSAMLYVSAPVADDTSTDALEFGLTTDLNGWSVALGATGAGDFGATAAGTVGAADLNFGFSSNDEWDVGVSYAFGAVTVGVETDETEVITANVDYDGGAFSAGLEIDTDENWEVSLGYDASGVVVDASFNSAEEFVLGATYDAGNGLTVGAGLEADESTYAFAEMDLGGGASAFLDWTEAAGGLEEVGPSERDIAEGTTVGLSFEF